MPLDSLGMSSRCCEEDEAMPVLVEHDVPCELRDGTVLRADVYRPTADGRHPALLLRTPYSKGLWPLTHLTLDPVRAAAAGYVVVIQDVRGRWASAGGVFDPYRDEFADGYDTVEWAAKLPYVDGQVGAYGVSYMGATAWHAAAAGPPSLRAIAPTTAPNDYFIDLTWRGGAFLWGTHVMWCLQAIGFNALVRARWGGPGLVPSLVRLVDDIDDYERWVRHLPPRTLPAAQPEDPSVLPHFFEAMRHPTRDDYHKTRGVYERHHEIRVPALILAGWHDALLGADLTHFGQMRESAATEEARQRTRIVIGPWAHGTFLNVVGDLDFGLRTSGLLIDLKEDVTALHLRWFDQRLKGRSTGIDEEAPVKLFVQGLNRWRDEPAWPLPRAVPTPWYLGADGMLRPEPPASSEAPDAYVYDPRDPCPTRGGALLLPRTHPPGPVDQEAILGRRDVLAYTSARLERDVEVTGPVKAVLYASTSARDTDWVVKLCDVHPDGRTLNVCDGILRARYRASWTAPALVKPEAIERYEIDLWATSQMFRAGHRLRILITSSDFPRYDRNPNTGELGVEAVRLEPALQRVFHDADHASHVLLPVIP
jgi:putative CocE/NonD family hydrolase